MKRQLTYDRLERIQMAAINSAKTNKGRSNVEYIEFHGSGYAEPGYDDPESGWVATGNWNTDSTYDRETDKFIDQDNTPSRLYDLLTKLGVECEWEDEWTDCHGCAKLVRTSANSYSWQAAYAILDCELLCHECIKSDPIPLMEALEGEDDRCLTIEGIDPEEYGYKLLEKDFEAGFHPGQDSDPKVIGKHLRELGVSRYLFRLDSVGQFEVDFSVYVHEEECDKVSRLTKGSLESRGHSISEAAQRGLQEAAIQQADLRSVEDQGVVHSRINLDDGTCTTRVIPYEKFAEKGIE